MSGKKGEGSKGKGHPPQGEKNPGRRSVPRTDKKNTGEEQHVARLSKKKSRQREEALMYKQKRRGKKSGKERPIKKGLEDASLFPQGLFTDPALRKRTIACMEKDNQNTQQARVDLAQGWKRKKLTEKSCCLGRSRSSLGGKSRERTSKGWGRTKEKD